MGVDWEMEFSKRGRAFLAGAADTRRIWKDPRHVFLLRDDDPTLGDEINVEFCISCDGEIGCGQRGVLIRYVAQH
jgi:hypothetical protein